MLTAVGMLILLLALVLLYKGFRGKVVGYGRACRRCGYDLKGTPTAKRCPECGADLTVRRSIRIEFRRKRLVLAALGALLLPIGSAVVAKPAQRAAYVLLKVENRPTWWLRQSLLALELPTCNDAADVLRRRIVNGEIDASEGGALFAALRERQRNRSASWSDSLCALVETGLQYGIFPKGEAQAQFLADSIRFEPTDADPDSKEVSWPTLRLREVRGVALDKIILMPERLDIVFAEHPQLTCSAGREATSLGLRRSGGFSTSMEYVLSFTSPAPQAYLSFLGAGSHPARFRLTYTVQYMPGLKSEIPARDCQFDFEGRVVLPRGRPYSVVDAGPFLAKLEIHGLDADGGSHLTVIEPQGPPLFALKGPPPPLRFSGVIYLIDPDGRVWDLGEVDLERGVPVQCMVPADGATTENWKAFDASRVTVVIADRLPTSLLVQRNHWSLTGRREFKDVPVWRKSEAAPLPGGGAVPQWRPQS